MRLALAALLAALPGLALGWEVDPEASRLGFVSIKNGATAESHRFLTLDGAVAEDGTALVYVRLDSVDTGVEIRDERMREMLFETARYPLAVVTAKMDLARFEGLAEGERVTVEAPLTVEAHGATVMIDALLDVTRIGSDAVSVSAAKPAVADARAFGLGDGVERLRQAAGLDAISPAAPVDFDIVFRR